MDIDKLWKEDHSELLENLLVYHKFDFEAVIYEFNKIMRIVLYFMMLGRSTYIGYDCGATIVDVDYNRIA